MRELSKPHIIHLDHASFLLDSSSYGSDDQAPDQYVIPAEDLTWNEGQLVAVSLAPTPPPELTITGPHDITEGEDAVFTLTATAETPANISVGIKITASGDYGVMTGPTEFPFPARRRTATFIVPTTRDAQTEPNGSVTATLTQRSGYVTGEPAAATVQILDYGLAINDVSLAEGDSGTKAFIFTVTAPAPVESPTTVNVRTNTATATAGVDFMALQTTLQFDTGERSKMVTVRVNGDAEVEPDETFTVTISSTEAVRDAEGVGTILNDDRAPGATDYDTDDDNLIELSNLAQLNALRLDPDGDGVPNSGAHTPYFDAFPDAPTGLGCPDYCRGYELAADLDFDSNGNGRADAADAYWNGGVGWDPSATTPIMPTSAHSTATAT